MVKHGEIWLAELDPTQGAEIRKTRPCVVASPDELNTSLRTVIVVPMTTGGGPAPFRPAIRFQCKSGWLACDQMGAVDKTRLVRRLGRAPATTLAELWAVLGEVFAR